MKRIFKYSVMVFVLLFLVAGSTFAELPEKSEIINNVPKLLEIKDFDFSIVSYSDQIGYTVRVQNNSDQPIEAYRITFVVFDYFDERCTGLNGVSHTRISTGSTEQGSWKDTDYSAWQGLTGFAFVSDLRLGDGTVVKANTDKVAEQMSELLGNPVDSEDLVKKQQ